MHRPLVACAALALLAACATPAPEPAVPSAEALSEPAPPPDLASPADTFDARLDGVLDGTWRSAANRARDPARHPKQTLGFFGLQAGQTVLELSPGGGWYAEILAPLMRGDGQYVALVPDGGDRGERLRTRFAAEPAIFGQPQVRTFDPAAPRFGADASADVLLTFRNVHNWIDNGSAAAIFDAAHAVLREGGTFGVVDHRARPGTEAASAGSGYVTVAQVVALAEAAGFRLVEESDINANPRDTTEHPNGVWTLPPTLRVPDGADAGRYRAIGESDRMTLKFVKPQAP
ncbi:class I SAM-dependent methyltransferase [Coralloluteibacterium stylophorae]|uniref:Class I SAM-dependent methyltransferase n=1 Tax=Coralloluteibacterium stylophorae TaxID=1776034 RepID=A0A8J8AWP1_9GAMM|nr:class I SAM-dependent methyltransferase [Coralloluteibacterium stylophorae]MBS7458145.1 class I SAM-dependent methyltransferase [Coralloluteibacterium stylophorae]